jgi:hypothetical protein
MTSVLLFVSMLLSFSPLQTATSKSTWRVATAQELQAALPARAHVVNERIETEARTASGIINQNGQIIAGVVLITAGYSADGKYSHYLLVQSPITVGDVALPAGSYVLGWNHVEGGLNVHLYQALTGTALGSSIAHELPSPGRVEAIRIWPPDDHSIIQIGRFALPYKLQNNP